MRKCDACCRCTVLVCCLKPCMIQGSYWVCLPGMGPVVDGLVWTNWGICFNQCVPRGLTSWDVLETVADFKCMYVLQNGLCCAPHRHQKRWRTFGVCSLVRKVLGKAATSHCTTRGVHSIVSSRASAARAETLSEVRDMLLNLPNFCLHVAIGILIALVHVWLLSEARC